MDLGEITAKLKLDSSQFDAGIKAAHASFAGLAAGFAEIAKVSGAAATALGGFGLAMVKLSAAVTETQSLAINAFGRGGALDLERWSADTAEAMGRSTNQMREFATGLQAMLSPTLGMTDATSEMSKSLARLAVDLASAYNRTDKEALIALQAALAGETEPMRRFGVNIIEANLQAFALSKGIRTAVSAMTEAQKQTLRYNFIISNTSIAHDDAIETAGSFANRSKSLQAALQEVGTAIGDSLLPSATEFIDKLVQIARYVKSLEPETIKLATSLGVSTAKFLAIGSAAAAAAAGYLKFVDAVKTSSFSVLGKQLLSISGPLLTVTAGLAGAVLLVGTLRYAWASASDDAKTSAVNALKVVGQAISDMLTTVMTAPFTLIGYLIDALATVVELTAKIPGAKSLFGDIDTSGLREQAKAYKDYKFDFDISLSQETKEQLRDAAATSTNAVKEGLRLTLIDVKTSLGPVLKDVLGPDLIGQFMKEFEAFERKFGAAGDTLKIGKQLGYRALPMPELTDEQKEKIAEKEYKAYLKRLDQQGKEIQRNTGLFSGLAIALRGTNERLKGGDWADSLVKQMAVGFSKGISHIDPTALTRGLFEGFLASANRAGSTLQPIWASVTKSLGGFGTLLSGIVTSLAPQSAAASDAIGLAMGFLSNAATQLTGWVERIQDAFGRVQEGLGAAFDAGVGSLIESLQGAGKWGGAIDSMRGVASGLLGAGSGGATLLAIAAAANPVVTALLSIFAPAMAVAGVFAVLAGGAAMMTAGVLNMAQQTKSWERLTTILSNTSDVFVAAFDPFAARLLPLAILLQHTVSGFVSLISAMAPPQQVFKELFYAAKGLALGIVNTNIAFQNVRLAASKLVDGFVRAYNAFAEMVGRRQISRPGDETDAIGRDRDAAIAARDQLIGLSFGAAMAETASVNLADALAATSEAFVNLPDGYRVALARFGALRDTGPGGARQDQSDLIWYAGRVGGGKPEYDPVTRAYTKSVEGQVTSNTYNINITGPDPDSIVKRLIAYFEKEGYNKGQSSLQTSSQRQYSYASRG